VSFNEDKSMNRSNKAFKLTRLPILASNVAERSELF